MPRKMRVAAAVAASAAVIGGAYVAGVALAPEPVDRVVEPVQPPPPRTPSPSAGEDAGTDDLTPASGGEVSEDVPEPDDSVRQAPVATPEAPQQRGRPAQPRETARDDAATQAPEPRPQPAEPITPAEPAEPSAPAPTEAESEDPEGGEPGGEDPAPTGSPEPEDPAPSEPPEASTAAEA